MSSAESSSGAMDRRSALMNWKVEDAQKCGVDFHGDAPLCIIRWVFPIRVEPRNKNASIFL